MGAQRIEVSVVAQPVRETVALGKRALEQIQRPVRFARQAVEAGGVVERAEILRGHRQGALAQAPPLLATPDLQQHPASQVVRAQVVRLQLALLQ